MSTFAIAFGLTIAASTDIAYSDAIEDANGIGLMNVEVANGSGQTVNDFIIQIKDHARGEWYTIAPKTALASPFVVPVRWASATNPSALTNGQKGHILADVGVAVAVRFGVTLAAGEGTVSVRGNVMRGR